MAWGRLGGVVAPPVTMLMTARALNGHCRVENDVRKRRRSVDSRLPLKRSKWTKRFILHRRWAVARLSSATALALDQMQSDGKYRIQSRCRNPNQVLNDSQWLPGKHHFFAVRTMNTAERCPWKCSKSFFPTPLMRKLYGVIVATTSQSATTEIVRDF